ncbi:hypothetical protein D3C78_570850 [compost metagenome]
MVEMLAVERRLAIGATRHQLAVGLEGGVGDLDDHRHPARRWRAGVAEQGAGRLHLAFADHRDHLFHLAAEDLAGNPVEGHLGLVAGGQAQLAVLPHPGGEVVALVGDEDHRRAQRQPGRHHARAQRHMGHETLARCPHHGVVQLVLGDVQLRLQVFHASGGEVHVTTVADVARGQFAGTGLVGSGRHQLRLDRLHPVLEGDRIDAEQHVAFLQRLVGLYRHLDHLAGNHRDHRRRDEVAAGHLRVGVVVVHGEDQRADQHHPAEYGGGHRPFVQRDAEDLEDGDAEGGVGEDEQEIHGQTSSSLAGGVGGCGVPRWPSSRSRRWSTSAICCSRWATWTCGDLPSPKPQPRSSR